MAKKKTTHQDKPTQNGENPHQSPPAMKDVSEKIESLKSLNSILLKETVERRQQVDSLQHSNGSLEMELKRFQMEKNELEIDLGEMVEFNLRGEIERDLLFVFFGVQVGEKFEVFDRERCDFEKKLGDFEREMARVLKEMSEIEEVKRERDCEIGFLKKELSDVLGEIESEKGVSSRVICEMDELMREFDVKIEQCEILKMKLVEVEEREVVIQEEVEELRVKCERLVEEKEDKERRIEVVLKEKGMVERSVLESNKAIEGLEEKIVELDREKEAVEVDRDLQVVKINELENDVSRLSVVVLELRKEEEKLCGNVDILEKKCCEGEAKEKELGLEIGKLVESLESFINEKGLVMKNLDEALKQSDELKSKVEAILKAKSVVECDKRKQEGEIVELKMQVMNLKDTIRSWEEASKAEKEKMEGLESVFGRYRDEVGRIITERDEARTSLRNTVTLVSKSIGENGIANQVKAEEEVKAYVAELDAVKEAFDSRVSTVEDMKRKLESLQNSEATNKKRFWTLLMSVTIFAAASVAYARH